MEFLTSICFLYTGAYLCLLVHELGHYLLVRRCGIRPYRFVIGVGPELLGFTNQKTKFSLKLMPWHGLVAYKAVVTRRERIKIALAGPLANFLLALILFATYHAIDYEFLYNLSWWSGLIGVFNLIPFSGSDGKTVLDMYLRIIRAKH